MKLVPNAVARAVAKRALVAQKNSPTVLFGVGVAGMIGSTALACRATLKMQDLLDEHNSDLEIAKTLEHKEYSEQDRQKDIAIIHVRTAARVAKLYAPAVVLGAASITCLTKSHNMLQQRNAAITAAYVALEEGFNKYRERVVEKYGEDEDRNLRYGTEQVEVVDDKGKKTTVTRVGPDGASIYARFFDPLSPSWSKEPEYNLLFLKCQQNWANDLLRARGHVFLNEVYDSLGIPHSKAGAVVGWVISDCSGISDNYIDFGIFDDTWNSRDFVNGREGSILLDFNVDGVIFDKIDPSEEAISWQRS